jgi:hypothetical protein
LRKIPEGYLGAYEVGRATTLMQLKDQWLFAINVLNVNYLIFLLRILKFGDL